MYALEADAARVRFATHQDEGELLELCRRNHVENGVGDFSAEKARALMRRAFDPGCNAPALIGVAGSYNIEGSIGIEVTTPWDADAPYLQILWHYTLPEARKSTTPKDLLAFATRLSEPPPIGVGLALRFALPAGIRTEAQVKMYTRQLGKPVGFAWVCGASNINVKVG